MKLILLPEALKAWRNQRGISQEALAREINVTNGAVAHYETGRLNPSYKRLCMIAEVLDVKPSALALIREEHLLQEALAKQEVAA